MARSLKTSTLTGKLKLVIAVDDDGAIKGWTAPGAATLTSGSGLAIHANVVTGDTSFRGTSSCKYFETKGTAGNSPEGICVTPNLDLSSRTNNKGMSVVTVMAGSTWTGGSGGSYPVSLQRSADTGSLTDSEGIAILGSPMKGGFIMSGTQRGPTTTTIPSDGTTKFTFGANYLHSGTDSYTGYTAGGQAFYCLEANAGSTASAFEPASPTGGGFQPNTPPGPLSIVGIGGGYNRDNHSTPSSSDQPVDLAAPGKYVLVAVFDDLISLADYQAIHDDPIGTLFESGASAVAAIAGRHYSRMRA